MCHNKNVFLLANFPQKKKKKKNAETLYRSDFFPGLGWMLTKSTWEELSPKWPKAYPCSSYVFLIISLVNRHPFFSNFLPWHFHTYWDDWVRLKEVHKDRQFIRPEICRTYNFGEHVSWPHANINHHPVNVLITENKTALWMASTRLYKWNLY